LLEGCVVATSAGCILIILILHPSFILLITEPFRAPVDWKGLGLYDYPQIVKKPMDLGTIKKKISGGKYKTIPEAARKYWRLE
jgi:hypothetical protein